MLALWTFLAFYCMADSQGKELVRDKRIIYGGYVGKQQIENYYSPIRYFTWISNGRECDVNVGLTSHWEIPVPTFLNLHCTPDPWHLLCGGAAITGVIVATACHCLADYDAPTKPYSRRAARAYNHWERFSTVFIGSKVHTHEYHYGIRSKGFIIHKKCALLQVANFEGWVIHDYGWIYLEKSLIFSLDAFPKGGLALGYAPSYTVHELAEMWSDVIRKQKVCLFIGYGRYEFIPGTANETVENSLRMKHGFNAMLDYKSCRDNTETYIPPGKPQIFKYEDDASWSCSVRFEERKIRKLPSCPGALLCSANKGANLSFKLIFLDVKSLASPSKSLTSALFGHGDSGGPVTCDSHYFGVVSQGKTQFYNQRLRSTLMMTNCNAFAIWQNAINYRASFIDYVKGLESAPNVFPTFRPFVPTGQPRFFEYQPTGEFTALSFQTSVSLSVTLKLGLICHVIL